MAEMSVLFAGPCIVIFTGSQMWKGYTIGEGTDVSPTQDLVTFYFVHAVMAGVGLCALALSAAMARQILLGYRQNTKPVKR